MNLQNLCMGCMSEKPQGMETCPFCGFNIQAYGNKINQDEQSIIDTNRKTNYSGTTAQQELPQRPLPVGTMLGENFIVGKKLGAGGFGVSYIGFDVNFERKVAIKEFYPRGYADRDFVGKKLIPRQGKRGAYFEQQRELFAHEGKVLAQIDEEGIVKVLSFCKENNTAYIIMEFLEGRSLSSYLKERGGYMPPEEALSLMRPVVKSLKEIHEQGLVHRDISPDNIMLTSKGPKLIDFGAALGKGEHPEGPPIGKKGYAPIEQLSRGGKVGAYSDVYALCAMFYQMITSTKPPRSMDRQRQDNIYTISAYKVSMRPVQEAAIMQGLAMDYNQRIKNAGDLYYLLYVYGVDANASVEGLQKQVRESSTEVITRKMQAEYKRSQNRMRMMIATACILIAGFLIIAVRVVTKNLQESRKEKPVVITETNVNSDDSEVNVQSGINGDLESYRDMLYEAINTDRTLEGHSTLGADKSFEAAANNGIASCVNITASTREEWTTKMTEAGINALSSEKIENAGWWIQSYDRDMSIDEVKSDLYSYVEMQNSGIENAVDLMNCNKLGISVGINSDGTYFWMVIYR